MQKKKWYIINNELSNKKCNKKANKCVVKYE